MRDETLYKIAIISAICSGLFGVASIICAIISIVKGV
jgi:hypothetical protein